MEEGQTSGQSPAYASAPASMVDGDFTNRVIICGGRSEAVHPREPGFP